MGSVGSVSCAGLVYTSIYSVDSVYSTIGFFSSISSLASSLFFQLCGIC